MPPPEPGRPGDFYRSAWLAYLVLAILGVLWLGYRVGELPVDLLFDLDGWVLDLAWGTAGGLGLLALWAAGRRWFGGMRRMERFLAEAIGPLDDSEALALALISGFAEELFFRGAMQTSWGLAVTTVIFACLHVGPSRDFLYWTLFAGAAGLVFGLLVVYRGNLLPAVVAHVVVNAVNLRHLARTGRAVAPAGEP